MKGTNRLCCLSTVVLVCGLHYRAAYTLRQCDILLSSWVEVGIEYSKVSTLCIKRWRETCPPKSLTGSTGLKMYPTVLPSIILLIEVCANKIFSYSVNLRPVKSHHRLLLLQPQLVSQSSTIIKN